MVKADFGFWHKRLSHVCNQKFNQLKSAVADPSVFESIIPTNDLCEVCVQSKQTRLPFNKSKDKSSIVRPLQVVHSDVCGPILPGTPSGKKYFVTFVDDFTHYCVVYLIREKSEVFQVFKDYVPKCEGTLQY